MMQDRTAPASTNRVAIYIRVSTTHQIDKDSLPMQRQDLIAYAKLMLNTDDYVIFEDAGYSGKNTDRPKFQEMMSQIRQGAFSHLLVWKIDRISRNLLDFATMYKELKDLGVVFVSKNEQFDTSTAMGEAMLKIILIREFDSNEIKNIEKDLVDIAADGVISEDEKPTLEKIISKLDEMSVAISELKLAGEKALKGCQTKKSQRRW